MVVALAASVETERLRGQNENVRERNDDLETRLDRIETELGIDATTDQRGVADD